MDISDTTRAALVYANGVAIQCERSGTGFSYDIILEIFDNQGVRHVFSNERDAWQFLEDQIDLMSFREACRRLHSEINSVRSPELNERIRLEQLEIMRRSGYDVTKELG